MVGKQSITLTYESVTEALQDYLHKHLLPECRIDIVRWEKDTSDNSYNATLALKVEFQPHSVSA